MFEDSPGGAQETCLKHRPDALHTPRHDEDLSDEL